MFLSEVVPQAGMPATIIMSGGDTKSMFEEQYWEKIESAATKQYFQNLKKEN